MTSWLPRGLGRIYRIGTKQAPDFVSQAQALLTSNFVRYVGVIKYLH